MKLVEMKAEGKSLNKNRNSIHQPLLSLHNYLFNQPKFHHFSISHHLSMCISHLEAILQSCSKFCTEMVILPLCERHTTGHI